jgi:nifR3 family TIM-barrel protein
MAKFYVFGISCTRGYPEKRVAPAISISALDSWELTARFSDRFVRFSNRMLLAPMEGVTDRIFRNLVLDLGGAGGASTEFVRIGNHVVRQAVFEQQLGANREDQPVAVQLMAAGTDHLPETIAQAEAAGAEWIDLNFGCPVKRVFGRGAGSALLADPEQLNRITATASAATDRPVSAKIRVGVEDDSLLDEILDAAGEGGAAMITLHARTRADSYQDPARWEWVAQAAARVHRRFAGVPLIGNGGVETAADIAEMIRITGCDGVMVGRAAIANPFLFNEAAGAAPATPKKAARFAARYLDALLASGNGMRGFGRFKQLLRLYRAGGIFDANRNDLLREHDPEVIREYLRQTARGTLGAS